MVKKLVPRLLILLIMITILLPFLNIQKSESKDLINNSISKINRKITPPTSLQTENLIFGIRNGDIISKSIMTNIGEKLNLNYSFQNEDSLNNLLTNVESGAIDFAFDKAYSDNRNSIFDFSIYANIEDRYLVSNEENLFENMYGKTIGLSRESCDISMIEENFDDVNIVYYDSDAEFFSLLKNEIVDGAIGYPTIFEEALREKLQITNLSNLIQGRNTCIITKKGTNESLVSLFNEYIQTKEYQNTLNKIKTDYYKDIYQRVLNSTINEYNIDSNVNFKVKFENNEPFSFFDNNNIQVGIFSDVLKEISNVSKMNFEITSVKEESWKSMFKDLYNEKIDILAPVAKSKERIENLIFSENILPSKYVIITRLNYENRDYTNINELLYENIGTIKDDVKEEILTNIFPNKTFTYFNSNTDLLKALSDEKINYILMNEDVFNRYCMNTKDFSIAINTSMGTIIDTYFCFAFPNSILGKQLAEIFSLSLHLVDTKEIVNQYIPNISLEEYVQQIQYSKNLIIIIFTISSFVLVLGIALSIIYARKTQKIAIHDFLTKLYNRKHLNKVLNTIVKENNLPLSVIVIDVNGLSVINNSLGHLVGDEFLIELSNILINIFGKSNVFRIGGDEFLVLMTNLSTEKTKIKVNKLLRDCGKIDKFPLPLSIGVGYSTLENKNMKFDEIFNEAENRLYRNKLFSADSRKNDVMKTLIASLHEKDPLSENHSHNVSNFSYGFSKILNISPEKSVNIRIAGELHDIGKIMIPTEILTKKGKLTKLEYEVMKTHAEIGFRIINSLGDMKDISFIILSHHERYDGKGYPRGLKKDEIPIESRIISISDAYDAMTGNRSYRDSISSEEALEEIKRCSGTQFDPVLVDLLVKNFHKIISEINIK